jgi:hypothetical protein
LFPEGFSSWETSRNFLRKVFLSAGTGKLRIGFSLIASETFRNFFRKVFLPASTALLPRFLLPLSCFGLPALGELALDA